MSCKVKVYQAGENILESHPMNIQNNLKICYNEPLKIKKFRKEVVHYGTTTTGTVND